MPRAHGIDHVSLAVNNIDAALEFFCGLFDVKPENVRRWNSDGFDGAIFHVGTGKFELLAPSDPNGFVARFLASRGEGVHHVTMQVENLEAVRTKLDEMRVPHFGDTTEEGIEETFIHPRNAFGVLMQLLETPWEVKPQD